MNDTVTYLPGMQLARGSFGCAAVGGQIYAVAGHVGQTHDWNADNFTSTCEAFDIASQTWRWINPRPAAAEGFRCFATSQYVYAFAGMVHNGAYASNQDAYASIAQIDRYDIAAGVWETIGELPRPRSDYMIGQIGSTLYFIGGWNVNGAAGVSAPPLQEVDYFDLSSEISGFSGYMFTEAYKTRVGAAALSVNNEILIFGGVHHPDMYNIVTAFNPAGSQVWRDLPVTSNMPIGVMDQTLWYNAGLDRVWVFGGYSSGELNSSLVFSARVQDLVAGVSYPWRWEVSMPQGLTFFGVEEIAPGIVGILGGSCNPATGGPQTADFPLYPLNMSNERGDVAEVPQSGGNLQQDAG